MSAEDFDLPAELETLLQGVCAEQAVPRRRHDEIRALLESRPSAWPLCCRGSCEPCVEESKRLAAEVLARLREHDR